MIGAMSHQPLHPSRLGLVLGLAAALLGSAVHGQTPTLYPTSLPRPDGSFAVGHSSTVLVDRSRVDPLNPVDNDPATPWGVQPRRIPVHFWYPADVGAAPRRDYVTDVREKELLEALGLGDLSGVAPLLRTNSVEGAPVAPGTFPLILFSPGFGFPVEFYQAYAEQLASRGFIFAAVHSPGINGPVTLDGLPYETPPDIPADLDEIAELNSVMTDDLVAALALIRSGSGMPSRRLHEAINFSRIGSCGHSFGASAALRLAARTTGITAVALLDGTIWGEEHAAGIAVNALILRSAQSAEDPTMKLAYDRLQGRGVLCQQVEVGHGGLSDLYFFNRLFEGRAADAGDDEVGLRPAANIRLTRELLGVFFEVELKGRSASQLTLFLDRKVPSTRSPGLISETKGY